MEELRAAAFEALLLNPGCTMEQWRDILVEQYPAEVVDALGDDDETVYSALADLWGQPYLDEATGIEQPLSVWAKCFSTETGQKRYFCLIDTDVGSC